MTKVNILYGGNSAERKVSLRSGAAVAKALEASGYEVNKLDPIKNSIDKIIECDVVFPVLHGVGGEDGTIQQELEKHNIEFVGSSSKASALCFDKWQYRQVVTKGNLPMANGSLVNLDNYRQHDLTKRPFVLKPVNGGSSIDTFIVRNPSKTPHHDIEEAFIHHGTLLIEELIDGLELTVGVLGDSALPIIEIVPPKEGEFDYENKYNGKSQENIAPEYIDRKIQKAAQALALQVHRLTGCRDISRTDIMCDKSGKLFLLETNTIPGMTDQSLFPKMAAAAGLPMPELCRKLTETSLQRDQS